jgi:assimilatory nitrate reductase catalytic subunit
VAFGAAPQQEGTGSMSIPPVRTTCPYCGVGCGVLAEVKPDGSVAVRGDPDHPANFGRLCSKGSALGETLGLDGRLLAPTIHGERASWDEALDRVASTFSRTIAEHGPDSVAFYVSGQLLTEDYYVANKLMKGFIGSANIDTNSRLCMSSSVAGHKRAFGSDTVPGTYEDLELADLVVLVGSNLAWCHPVIYQRIVAAKQSRPEMRVVVIDPRRTLTADIAELHLPLRSDGDCALFAGLLTWLADNGPLDRAYIEAHTTGFQAALIAARSCDLAKTAELTGLPIEDLRAFYELFAATEKTVTVYSQGVNQSSSGTDKVNAIINCHLATGRIGKPGAGPFSITGQPNAMGGREVGGLANMLAAHMEIDDPADRERVQRFWSSPRVADRAGLKAVDMFRAVADGRVKAIWIMATNPVDSMPEADAVAAALKGCPFVVVSDLLVDTDTMRFAHIALPATAWGEKDGAVTNSERRISRQRAFLPAPGGARADWAIIADVARRMGFGDAFAWESPAEIFAEHAALSAFENDSTRDFDLGAYAELSCTEYETMEPFQWPQPGGAEPTTRFFACGGFFTPDRKARFVPVVARQETRVSKAFPFTLNTGRVRDHWHTMTRTGKSPRLSQHFAEPFCEIHPADAAALGVDLADLVTIATPHAEIVVRALVSPRQARGSVFAPMHWNDQFAAKARVDALIPSLIDAISGQPASKNAAACVARFEAARFGFAVLSEKPLGLDAEYWALAPCIGGWRIELAFRSAERDWAAFAASLFGAEAKTGALSYVDEEAGQLRFAAFAGDRLVGALFLAAEPVAVSRNWAVEQLSANFAQTRARFSVVAGRAGKGVADNGATVCSCFGIGAKQIVAAALSGCVTVDAIGVALQAGTNCGSCRSEINGILDAHRLQAAE